MSLSSVQQFNDALQPVVHDNPEVGAAAAVVVAAVGVVGVLEVLEQAARNFALLMANPLDVDVAGEVATPLNAPSV